MQGAGRGSDAAARSILHRIGFAGSRIPWFWSAGQRGAGPQAAGPALSCASAGLAGPAGVPGQADRAGRPSPAGDAPSLPEGAPALVLAVPAAGEDGLAGLTAEIATVLRVDNPALDVQVARIDDGGRGDPAGIRSVLAGAAARRPEAPLGRGDTAGRGAAPGRLPGK